MRRYSLLAIALLLVISGCGGSNGDTTDSGPDTTATPADAVTPLGGTYWGDFDSQTGLTGRVKIQVADDGDLITGLEVVYDMSDYPCDGATLTIERGVSFPIGIEVPLTDGAFSYGSDPTWDGVIVSESRIEGSIAGSILVGGGPTGPPRSCDIGSLSWSADLADSTGSTSAPTTGIPTATVPTTTATPPTTATPITSTPTTTSAAPIECDPPAQEIVLGQTLDSELISTGHYPENATYYCVMIPDGTDELTIDLTGMLVVDLDLYVSFGSIENVQGHDAGEWSSDAYGTVDEQVVISSPQSGAYYIEVVSYAHESSVFTLTVSG